MAHVVEALNQIVKVEWVQGVKTLFSFRRVKQLVGSITSVEGLTRFIADILSLFEIKGNAEIKNQILASLDQPPYVLVRIVLGIKLSIPVSSRRLKQDALPFFE